MYIVDRRAFRGTVPSSDSLAMGFNMYLMVSMTLGAVSRPDG